MDVSQDFGAEPQHGLLAALEDMGAGRFISASEKLKVLIQKEVGDAYPLLAQTYQMSGHPEQAETVLKTWLENGGKARGLLALCDFYFGLERSHDLVEVAMTHATRFEFSDLQFFHLYRLVGNSFIKLGDLESGEEFFNKAYRIQPDSDVLLVNYGMLEIQRNDWARAKEYLVRALSTNGQNVRAWIGLSLVHRHLQDNVLAWANLHRAADIDPKHEIVLGLKAMWQAEDAQSEKAKAVQSRLLSSSAPEMTIG